MKLSFLLLAPLLLQTMSAKRVFDGGDKFKPLKIDKRGMKEELPLFKEPQQITEPNDIFIPNGEEPQRGPTLLTSTISTAKDISIFAFYVRDNVDISFRFNDKNKQSIVFAPTNQGIETLSLKPWQFPIPVDETKSEEETEKIIASNTNDFVLSHIVNGELPFSVLEGSKKGVQFVTENGNNIKLVNDNGEYYVTAVVNGVDQEWIKVLNVINADNGAILVISKPLSTPKV